MSLERCRTLPTPHRQRFCSPAITLITTKEIVLYGAPRDQLRARLAACHAFEEDLKSYRLVFPERAG